MANLPKESVIIHSFHFSWLCRFFIPYSIDAQLRGIPYVLLSVSLFACASLFETSLRHLFCDNVEGAMPLNRPSAG